MNYSEEEFREMADWRFQDCSSLDEAKIRLYNALITGPSIRYYKIDEDKLREIKNRTAKEIEEAFRNYSHVLPSHLKN